MRKLIAAVILLFLPSIAWADYTCTVPTDGTFAECVAACDGKTGVVTIDVGAGSITWSHVDMSAWEADSVVIKGAGVGVTTAAIPALSGDVFLTAKSTIPFELYGFTFTQATAATLYVSGVPINFKIHDNSFPLAAGAALWIRSTSTVHPYGVIYKNTLWKTAVTGNPGSVVDDINSMYSQQPAWGADETASNGKVYVEGNTFPDRAGGGYITDGNNSGRIVFRFNTIEHPTTSSVIAVHSINNDSTYFMRGAQAWEVYNNYLSAGSYTYRWMNMRSGTGFVWNNAIVGTSSGFGSFVMFDNVRSIYGTPDHVSGMCDGAGTWDENLTIDSSLSVNTAKYGSTTFTGTHTGNGGDCTNDCATLVDSTKAWTVNSLIKASPYNGTTVYNTTDGSKCTVTANTATSITCTLAGGTDNNWDIGDNYRISNGYPCRDQIGRYYDPGGWDNDPIQANETQGFQPAYVWGNYRNGSAYNVVSGVTGNSTLHIVNNRDYFTAQSASCTAGGACTTGVGSGLSTNKPTTCTVGTGFYATDEVKLYHCSSENTWTLLYTPETCPHPLADPEADGYCDYTATGASAYNLDSGAPPVSPWTVTPTPGTGCSIDPSVPTAVDDGLTLELEITNGTGGGTCGGSQVGTTYTTSAVTANCTVTCTALGGPGAGVTVGSGPGMTVGSGPGITIY